MKAKLKLQLKVQLKVILKNITLSLALCGLLVFTAASCTGGSSENSNQSGQNDAVMRHKKQAPVTISTSLKNGVATVILTFIRDADAVSISHHGIDGMALQAAPMLTNQSYSEGEVVQFDFTYTAPEGRSYLSVQVAGSFNGQEMFKVQAFPTGELSQMQKMKHKKNVSTNSENQPVHLMQVIPTTR